MALRWALLLFVVFDQMGAPLHGHRHDSGIDGRVLAQMRQTDGVLVAAGAAFVDRFAPNGVHPSTPIQIHTALSVVEIPFKEPLSSWLGWLAWLSAFWPDWPDTKAASDDFVSVDLPPPRWHPASAPLHTRAPPLRA
ncbi:hypothetical protein FXN63_03375 [Pigmentiphaga aceris]|uniref:Uncharacterized protein n=1 Tax=Pigmentiphaga aceris TaxID=1940612 RepID=A0A5C0AS19_9BURK|nr:hypothetical protein [Pigmentiphaga aceris]QEI04989.1 hypothetical protein FXN63_03375 [Pigmentiphaga aceris]